MKLVIAEKPSVAKTIAEVIGATNKKKGYFEGQGYIVSWCIGHLIELAQPEQYEEEWKKWNYNTLPMIPAQWQYTVQKNTMEQYKLLKALMDRDEIVSVVCATDAGREGELIFRLVYNQAKCKKPIKRLWISSMEESAIREGFENLKPGSDYDNLYKSALCRQQADWLVGLNGTRLFTVLYGGKLLKVGRVQTPTLAMLVEREEKIKSFQKERYYMAHIMMEGIDAATVKITDRAEAERIADTCQGKNAENVLLVKENKSVSPPKLYDLTTLQRDANRIFGYTAKQCLEYTQSLYEKKLVTYPRTDSQFLSDDMEDTAVSVIQTVIDMGLFAGVGTDSPNLKRILNSKKVTDHHAIIPTLEIGKADLSKVPEAEKKILCMIANRFLCAVAEKYEYEHIRAEFICEDHVFTVNGKNEINMGWKGVESSLRQLYKISEEKSDEDKKLPKIVEGQLFNFVETRITEHLTQPPKHFTEDSLLLAMERAGSEEMCDEVERKGLGTPATRADIIEKLVKDGFVQRVKKQLLPTEDGIRLISILPYGLKSPKLTADWENTLTLISKGEYEREKFMEGIVEMVTELVQTNDHVSDEQKSIFGLSDSKNVLGNCPKCGGSIVKGKFGAYCKNQCGMNVSRAMGSALSDTQIKALLAGKKIYVKNLKGKKGDYDAYLIPVGISEYSYTKDGKEMRGFQYKFKFEYPDSNKK